MGRNYQKAETVGRNLVYIFSIQEKFGCHERIQYMLLPTQGHPHPHESQKNPEPMMNWVINISCTLIGAVTAPQVEVKLICK
jgi:hypothetical protein